jgi:hypothetical protein
MFMPNGSLDSWLHPPGYGTTANNLDLSQRLKIAVDIADILGCIHLAIFFLMMI